MTKATVELYKEGDHMAVVTNAAEEGEFFEAFCELLSSLIEEGRYNGDWEFQLRYWLPQATNVVCKLRGYKADVTEERLIIAGEFARDSAIKVAEIGPQLSAAPEAALA